MDDIATTAREFSPIERQALEHVWIHSARWLDLAERDGLKVMVRGAGFPGSTSSMSATAGPKSARRWPSRRAS